MTSIHMRVRLGAVALGVGALFLSSGCSAAPVPAPAPAQQREVPEPAAAYTVEIVRGGGDLAPEPASLADARAYSGTSREPLSDREVEILAAQPQIVEAIEDVVALSDATYLEHGLRSTGAADGWISFSERPGDAVFDALEALPIDVEVRWGFDVTRAQADAALDVAMAAVARSVTPDAAITGTVSPSGVLIEVAWEGDPATSSELDELEEAARDGGDGTPVSPGTGFMLPVTVEWNRDVLDMRPEIE